jgi:glycosyltransferase involved in cell wall biosynthesis
MTRPFLSIIIPTLNEEKYLPILLSSLVSQIYKNFEVIVSDAKSGDKTKEKALEFKDRLDIKVYDSDKRNVSYQRNLGAKKAKGDYLIFLDADFTVNKDFIEKIKKVINNNNDLFVLFEHANKSLFLKIYFLIMNILATFSPFILRKPFVTGPALIIKTDFFNKIEGYDESVVYGEDQDIVQRAYRNKAKIKYANSVRVAFSVRRIEKEGFFHFLFKNSISTIHIMFLGAIRGKFIKHDMGGHEYIK